MIHKPWPIKTLLRVDKFYYHHLHSLIWITCIALYTMIDYSLLPIFRKKIAEDFFFLNNSSMYFMGISYSSPAPCCRWFSELCSFSGKMEMKGDQTLTLARSSERRGVSWFSLTLACCWSLVYLFHSLWCTSDFKEWEPWYAHTVAETGSFHPLKRQLPPFRLKPERILWNLIL